MIKTITTTKELTGITKYFHIYFELEDSREIEATLIKNYDPNNDTQNYILEIIETPISADLTDKEREELEELAIEADAE